LLDINKIILSDLILYFVISCRIGLVEVLLGLLDWRAGGTHGLCTQMKWNESEASVGRVLAVEVSLLSLLKLLLEMFPMYL
jgi:hypothetical protein